MKKYLSLLVVLFATLFTVNSFAYDAPPKPANGGYVLDEVGKLSQDQINQLNRKIETLKQNTKNEFGVAIIQSTGGADISDVGQTIFRSWGIGNAQLNNGVLLVIAMAEHKTRIQTGKGVEGDLPDLKANDILQLQLKPLLKQGKFYEGIDTALNAISTSIDDRTKQVAALPPQTENKALHSNDSSSSGSGWLVILLLGGAGLVGLVIFLAARASQREEEEQRQLELQRRRDEERARRKREEDAWKREATNLKTSPEVPAHKSPNYVTPVAVGLIGGAAGLAAGAALSEAERARHKREEEARRRRDDEERTQRENRRRREEEESRRSSYTSSSYTSSSWSSSDSGSFGGGGFGGGDSGGGGSSGDF